MKTKIFIVGVIVLVILLVFVGVRYSDKILPEGGTVTQDTQSRHEITTKEGHTTVKPFVEAQTQIIANEATVPTESESKEQHTAKHIPINSIICSTGASVSIAFMTYRRKNIAIKIHSA